jgi:hypothetical protein
MGNLAPAGRYDQPEVPHVRVVGGEQDADVGRYAPRGKWLALEVEDLFCGPARNGGAHRCRAGKGKPPPLGRRGSGLVATVGAEGKGAKVRRASDPVVRGGWATRPLYQYKRAPGPIPDTETEKMFCRGADLK